MTIKLLMFNCRGGIGLENRHSERVSGFDTLALRYARMVELEDTPDLESDATRHEGSTPSPSTVLWLPSLKVRTSAFQAEDAGFKSRGGHYG